LPEPLIIAVGRIRGCRPGISRLADTVSDLDTLLRKTQQKEGPEAHGAIANEEMSIIF